MAEVTINYKDAAIATMDASGTKTLQTQGKYCEDDIEVVYARPSGGGGSIDWDGIAEGTWPTGAVVISTATSIRAGAFFGDTGITSVQSSSVTTIGRLTMDYSMYALQNYATFGGCTNLASVDFPNVTAIGPKTFLGCEKLTSVNMPKLETLGINASTDGYCFRGCSRLQRLYLPACTQVNGSNGTLSYVGSTSYPITIVLPAITEINQSRTFQETQTAAIDIGPNLSSSFPTRCFYNGTFPLLILRKSSGIIPAATSDAISSLGSGTTIYIPEALYDHLGDGTSLDYKAATNWSAKANDITWAKIEGSIYETQYADGTPIT